MALQKLRYRTQYQRFFTLSQRVLLPIIETRLKLA